MDVSPWLRPDAPTSPDRLFCHVHGRAKGNAQMIPGWPYSFVAALETGRSSWTAVLDAVRLGPADDATAVTAAQLRDVVDRLIAAGHWRPGDPNIVIVADTGYDITRLAHVLADLPVELVGRLRSDRVLRPPKPPAPARHDRAPPPKHGPEIALDKPATWPTPRAHEQHRHHPLRHRGGHQPGTGSTPRLTHRGCWIDHEGELPIIEGTLIRLQVEHLPGDRDPKPVWLWTSITGATAGRCGPLVAGLPAPFRPRTHVQAVQADPRLDHPELRDPDAGRPLDLAGHRRAHPTTPGPTLVADLRRPWERPAPPGRLTPARVRRGFRNIRPTTLLPARAPKPSRPGPGRPPGSRNRHPATSHDVGKTVKRDRTIGTARQRKTLRACW